MGEVGHTSIDFRAEQKVGSFLDPRDGFKRAESGSEIRFDPLTGDTARICHFTLDSAPPIDFRDAVEAARETCPFCPERVFDVTPRFESDLVSEGRVQRGEAVVFPNLFPYDDYSAITVVSRQHALSMEDMPPAVVTDAFAASVDFLRRVDARRAAEDQLSYPFVTWNYMPPAGASQLHPHLQVIHTSHPANGMRRRLAAERAWTERTGEVYPLALSAAERASKDRWIGRSGAIEWTAPFLPTGMLGDCQALFPDRSCVTDLTDADIGQFADGLCRALTGFAAMGFCSFNLVLAGGAAGNNASSHRVTAAVVPRFYVNPHSHACDVAYMQLCLSESFSMIAPEETARRLREHWT